MVVLFEISAKEKKSQNLKEFVEKFLKSQYTLLVFTNFIRFSVTKAKVNVISRTFPRLLRGVWLLLVIVVGRSSCGRWIGGSGIWVRSYRSRRRIRRCSSCLCRCRKAWSKSWSWD